MQIQTYSDRECTQRALIIDAPNVGSFTLTSGNVNTYTVGGVQGKIILGAVKIKNFATAPAKLFAQYTTNLNQLVYIKTAEEGESDARLNLKCGLSSVVDPSKPNMYTYTSVFEYYDGSHSNWINRGSGGSDLSIDAEHNLFACELTIGADTFICIYYQTTTTTIPGGTETNVHGFFADKKFFESSKRPRTKSQTPTVSPGGHYGTGTTTPGNMTFSGAPAAWSHVNATEHGLRVYTVYDYNMELLYRRLWSKDVWQRFTNSRYSPISGILAYHRLPIRVPTSTSVTEITICGQDYQIGNDQNKLGVASDGIVPIDAGSAEVPEVAGSFLDYAPYCSAVLHLPYIGNMPIDINKISGGKLQVRYWIDICSGNCMAHVLTTDRDGSSIIYGEYAGNCAYKYPVTGNDQGGTAVLGAAAGAATAGLVALVGGGAAGITAGKAAAGVLGAAGGLAQAELNADHHLQQAGSWPANTGTLCDPNVYLIVTRPAYLTPDNYPSIVGYPAGTGHTVQSFINAGGGILAGEIHAEGIDGATDAERDAIEAAFRGGVFV